MTVAGTSSWDAGASLGVNCVSTFGPAVTFGADPNLNQVMTGVALISQDINNGKVSSKTASQINLSDQVSAVVSQSLSLTSTFLNIDNFNTGAESALTNDGLYFSNNTNPNAGSKLDLLEARINSTNLTYANMSAVGGNPTISVYQNDGLGTVNQQTNLTTTGFGTQDNLYQTVAAMNVGGYISATSRSTGATQPMLLLTNTAAGTGGVAMEAYKNKPSAGVAGDEVFRLSMFGKNSGNLKDEYGRITCNIRDPSGPTAGADGQLLFAVPVGDTMTTFIDLNGNSNQINTFKNINLAAGTAISFSNSTSQTTAYTGFQPVSTTTYTNPSITFNTFGQITAVTNGATVGALTALPIATPTTVASGSGINIVTGSILASGVYLIFGCVNFLVSSGASYFNFCNITFQKNAVDFFQSNTAGNTIFTLGVNLPIIPYSSSGTDVLTIYSNGCQVANSSNYTISNSNSNTRIYAMKIAN